jgi:hypothetical protein
MALQTAKSLLLRQDVFLLALVCMLAGTAMSNSLDATDPDLGAVLAILGGFYIVARLLYGVGLVLYTSYLGWQSGYDAGRDR